MLKHIFSKKNKVLLSELVRTDFKLRYQGSVLGYSWSLLRPLLLFLTLYIVFAKFLRIGGDIPHYPIYLLLGIVLWQFFADMTSQSLGSIVGRGDLIRKIRIPRWMIVLSSSVSALINLGFNMIIVGVFMVFSKTSPGIGILLFPLVLAEIYILSLGVSLFLAAAFVKYRDINYIWEVILQAGFYATPILYPITLITNVSFQKVLLLNPIAQAIQDARNFMVSKDTVTIAEVFQNSSIRLVPIALCVFILIAGILYFRKHAGSFAENL